MEPMDYTMESDQPPQHQHPQQQHQHNAARCPYYQPSPYNNFLPPRDAHHYDPVHNTESWHQASVTLSPPNQSTYAAPQPPHWVGSRPFTNGWHSFGEQRMPNPQLPFHVPGPEWVQPRGLGGAFGYGYSGNYASLSHGNGSNSAVENNNSRTSAPISSASTAPVNAPPSTPSSMLHTEAANQHVERFNDTSSPSHDPSPAATRRRLDEITRDRAQADRAIQESYQNHIEEQRASQARAARAYARTYAGQESALSRRNRRLSFGSSDDADEDSDDLIEHYHQYFHHDETTLAALRGMAAGKRVTSKSAIAALEQVDLQELKDADRTCIICYNEFGVENPEGLIESPIRLPKCKHVFGDACIRKWFEDSDSCPYCRDKLPSEPMYVRQRELLERLGREAQQSLRSSRVFPTSTRHSTIPDDFASGFRIVEGAGRNQDEYNYFLGQVQADRRTSQNSPPNRSFPSDTPDSRRRRGRMGVHRALPPPRPTSVGSSRFNASSSQQPAYRAAALASTAANTSRTSYVPQINVQPTRNPDLPPSAEEAASPPVAVGSSSDTARAGELSGAMAAEQGRPDEHTHDATWDDGFGSSRSTARVHTTTAVADTNSPPPRIPLQTRPNISSLSQHYAFENNLPRISAVSDTSNPGRYGSGIWNESFQTSARLTPPQFPRWSR